MNQERVVRVALWILLAMAAFWAYRHFGIAERFGSDEIAAMVASYGPWAPVMFISILALATLVFVPLIPLMIIAGVLFGTWLGGLYSTIGATIGAVAAFLLGRHAARHQVERLLGHRYHSMLDYYKKYEAHSFKFVVVTVIAPFLPFRPFNYLMGLTSMPLRNFAFATAIGLLPVMLVYAYIGDTAVSLKFDMKTTLLLLGVLAASVYLWYELKKEREEN